METALHQLAKELIMANKGVATKKGLILYDNLSAERMVGYFRTDVLATYGGHPLSFEVVVHHKTASDKKEFYVQTRVRCIETDLSDPRLLTADLSVIEDAVIRQTTNKSFLYWEEGKPVTQGRALKKIVGILLAAVVVLFFIRGKRSGMKIKKKRK